MDFIEHLVDHFNKPKEETENQAPEGVCPNCWGYQQYDHKIRKLFEDKQIDVINHENKYTFMRKFVKEYISGIRLLKGEVEVCPTCGLEHPKKDKLPVDKIVPGWKSQK